MREAALVAMTGVRKTPVAETIETKKQLLEIRLKTFADNVSIVNQTIHNKSART